MILKKFKISYATADTVYRGENTRITKIIIQEKIINQSDPKKKKMSWLICIRQCISLKSIGNLIRVDRKKIDLRCQWPCSAVMHTIHEKKGEEMNLTYQQCEK